MLSFPKSAPLPTFESFLEKAVEESASQQVTVDPIIISAPVKESAPPGLDHVDAALEAIKSEMTLAKVEALSKYSNAEEAAQSLYDWACKELVKEMKRELDEEEQSYVQDKFSFK